MRAPVRPISGAWPKPLEDRLGRFFRADARLLVDPLVTPGDFTRAMSSIHVGDTVKITKRNRHPEADSLLLHHLDLERPTIVDIGASDGSTSLDLIRSLPDFASFTVADLYLSIHATRVLGHIVFHDAEGDCILVSGRWWAAWPKLSRGVATLCRPLELAAERHPERRMEVTLVNPELRDLMARDKRISLRMHDIFSPWPAPAPDVIKVANLLRRVYFSDADIVGALEALLHSLDEGGYLLIVDDGKRYKTKADRLVSARAGLYRRTGDRFAVVDKTHADHEISDLVAKVRGTPPAQVNDEGSYQRGSSPQLQSASERRRTC